MFTNAWLGSTDWLRANRSSGAQRWRSRARKPTRARLPASLHIPLPHCGGFNSVRVCGSSWSVDGGRLDQSIGGVGTLTLLFSSVGARTVASARCNEARRFGIEGTDREHRVPTSPSYSG